MDRRDTTNRSFRPGISNRDNSSSYDPDALTAFRFEAQTPRTPPTEVAYVERPSRTQGQGIRAPRARPSITGIFPDAPVHPADQDDERRSASNELSYPHDNARDSLVNQILMSLDSAAPDNDDSDLREQSHSFWGSRRARGHTHSSSTSSAFFRFARDRSRSQSRGRHTKNKSSGSDFQSTLDRIQSVRTAGQQKPASKSEWSTSDPRPSTQGKSRKSANTSLDNSQAAGQQRRVTRRSISFDQGHSRTFSGNTIRQVTMDSDRDPGSEYEGIEASRTTSSSTSAPRQGHNGSVSSTNLQALRPARSNTVGLRKPGTSPQRPIGGADGSMQGADDTDDGSRAASIRDANRTQAPPIPRTIRQRTDQNSSYKAMAFSPNATVGKEKGGFFKRMFGGSSKSAVTTPDAQVPTKALQASMRNDSYQTIPDENTAAVAQQSGAVAPNPASRTEPKEPSLNKKASFFRRRKKSIAAPAPAVPSLPSNTDWQGVTEPLRDQSPASSLRKVMNPYLANSRPGTRTGHAALRTDPGESLDQQSEVRLYPMQDAGHAYDPESSSHAHPVPSPQPMNRQWSANRDGPDRDDLQHRDQPAATAARSDDAPQNSELSERASRRKTLTAPSSSGGAPTRSSSKGWRDRPQTRVYTSDQSRRSTSGQRRPGIVRTETDASEVSDSDFTSAKSQVVSPIEDTESEPSKPPPLPSSAPPVPNMIIATTTPAATGGKDERSVLTPETARLRTGSNFVSTLDPARTPTYVPQDLSDPLPAPIQPEEDKPTDEDHAIAEQLFHFNADVLRDEPSLPKNESDICAWLGEAGEGRARIRTAYLEMFDWKDCSILIALRKFCEHVKLKGETQQVDRILEGIARRWTESNPLHGFKAVDVIHTICYSLILLNTDLHIADIENRMTRAQFVKNTMQTVLRVVDDAAPDAFKQSTINAAKRASTLPPQKPSPLDVSKKTLTDISHPSSPHSPKVPTSPQESGTVKLTVRRNSNEFQRGKFRLSARPSDNTAIEALLGEVKNREAEAQAVANEDCGPLVRQPFFGGRAAWETQVETVLKNFYNGIQKQRLPLQGGDTSGQKETSRAPSSLGQTSSGNKLGRTPSISSRQSGGERGQASRPTTGTTSRWRNKMAQRPRIYAASNFSVDDDMSMAGASPSASSLWSKHSLGRTQTSMSVTSFRSEAPGQEAYQQSIGFANALSQAIIREENDGADGDEKDGEALKAASLLDDEGLELYGAPWAKEGIVKHKHHLESIDKKAKERAWTECFAVIQKGWLQLFRFNSSKTASIRARAMRAAVGGVSNLGGGKGATGGKVIVGGGNWMDNALPLGRFLLRQTIASALPPPGYSKSRPHVWALSLPNGAVHLFQAGTPEIVREYVTCANYWSARLSKEPLVGGVSNVEYGWSENLLNTAIIAARPGSRTDGPPSSMAEALAMSRQRSGSSESSAAPAPGVPRTSSRGVTGNNRPPSAMHSARPSLQNSIRNSFDTTASAAVRPRMPGDRANLHDWQPPQQSMVASALMEVDQLRVLSDYVAHITRELEKHNELRPAIQLAYAPRHPNFGKAMSNFEKKSAYLLREIVKFNTYVEALQTAQTKKEEVLKERDDRKKEMEADRAKEELVKVETAEELRRELSRSDLRLAAKSTSEEPEEDVPEVPALPDAGMITKS